ncbi:hypothetical protein ES702_00117 [subsurface metagenome]
MIISRRLSPEAYSYETLMTPDALLPYVIRTIIVRNPVRGLTIGLGSDICICVLCERI